MSITILDVFNQNAFGVVSLTGLINDITPQYGLVSALGLFTDEGVSQRTAVVDFDPFTNSLLPQSVWGGPGVANKTLSGRSRAYSIPHFNVQDAILAGDLQGRRMAGSDATLTAQVLMAKKAREIKLKLLQTLEFMRLGVLKSGQVKDGAGNLILDVYADFGVAQAVTSLVLGTTTTKVLQLLAPVTRASNAALRGSPSSQKIALCSDGFWDAFVNHTSVQTAFQFFQNNTGQNLSGDYSSATTPPDSMGMLKKVPGFEFGGVTWMNYSGSVSDANGASQPMIDTNSAYIFPLGTDLFKTFYSPADYIETVNTEGQQFYMKQEPMKFGKGIEIDAQTNPLPICLKPQVIQKVTV